MNEPFGIINPQPSIWRELPWLLTHGEVRRLTGLSHEELHRLAREGILRRHAPGRRGRYYKQEIMRLCAAL